MLMILALSLFGALFSASGDSGPVPNKGTDDLQAQIRKATEGDLATSMNEATDRGEAILSPGMYRAIQAVQGYRSLQQKRTLTGGERNFANFNISVYTESADTSVKWLDEGERPNCYVVRLSARRLPGEIIYTDTPPKLGRTAFYAVRKSDFRILRSQVGEQIKWTNQ